VIHGLAAATFVCLENSEKSGQSAFGRKRILAVQENARNAGIFSGDANGL